jgi:hypothetical protein
MVHPLVTTSMGLLTMIRLLGFATDQDYKNILRAYKVGSLSPLKTGSGDIMLYLLGPSVVSFAVAMYSRRTLLKANFAVVASAVTVGSLGSLYGTAAFVRAISLGGKMGGMIRLSMLPRSVTTALAMVISSILGGDVPIAAAVVSLTGIMGATYGRTLLDAFKISDPVTRGLAIGAAGQGLGVASIAGEPDAFPFAAMAMVRRGDNCTQNHLHGRLICLFPFRYYVLSCRLPWCPSLRSRIRSLALPGECRLCLRFMNKRFERYAMVSIAGLVQAL